MKLRRALAAPLVIAGLGLGCGESGPAAQLAPSASALVADAPATAAAVSLVVDGGKSAVRFTMDAPFEKIHGDVPGGLSGAISIDPADLRKTTALLAVDLSKLELFQQKRDDEKSEYGERVKNDKQNEHARTWLEIGPDAPEADRTKFARSEFRITKVTTETPDLSKGGAERKARGTLTGELLLHGRKLERTVAFEATLRFEGGRLAGLTVKTETLEVGLDEFDVRPRDAFGKLAQKTLGDLAGKVSKAAPVVVELVAAAKP